MGSINAQVVARKVLLKVRKGEKVSVSKIMRESGYSKYKSAHSDVVKTSAYKNTIELEKMPLLEGLQLEINTIKQAMAMKDKSKEEYRTLVGSLDVLTRNYQLLSGGATERQVFVLPSEVMARNQITQSKDDVKSINGSVEPFKE